MKNKYPATYAAAAADPSAFWLEAAKSIDWIKSPSKGVSLSNPPAAQWFEDGVCNTCFNAVDRHATGERGDQPALIYHSAMTGARVTYSYKDLLRHVASLAGAMKRAGAGKGDRVVIYMPMIPEAVFAMLACARIGAVHSVVFGGFAAAELAKRIDDAAPKLLLTASCGLEPSRIVEYKPLVDAALETASHTVDKVILFQRPELRAPLQSPRDIAWDAFLENASDAHCEPIAATDPLYILYTSGTTGAPKGVVRDNGGHMTALAWSMGAVYNIHAGDVFWAASDIGWVVGHSYIVYAPLLIGATTVLYEGKPVGTPDAGEFWRVINQYNVKTLFTAPTAFRAIKGQDPSGGWIERSDLRSLKALFLAGERADPDTVNWARDKLNIPVIDHWWQTELGWPALATCLGLGDQEARIGSAGKPVPGFRVDVVDEAGAGFNAEKTGEIVIRPPLAPGAFTSLWRNKSGYERNFDINQIYKTGDAGHIDENGFISVMSRTDDLINVAGHRLSTGMIEQIIADHPDVAECAVIGVKDDLKGQRPVGLYVLNAGVNRDEQAISEEIIAQVREEIGPVAAFKSAFSVSKLPKTRSGKVLRATLRKIANGEPYPMPPTIEDPGALDA
ncbi:MAG: AMP-binding protein, partial [Pseudomonadota bacterium]